MAERVAKQAGLTLSVTPFDGGGDDEGFTTKKFRQLLTSQCALVMGYPVDTVGGAVPPGLLATKPYAQTGFVLVTAPGETARTLADLAPGTEVAVTYQTAPNLYFPDHGNIQPDVHTSDSDTMQAVAKGIGQSCDDLAAHRGGLPEAQPGSARLGVFPLQEPHARYDVVALYLPQSSHSRRPHSMRRRYRPDVPARWRGAAQHSTPMHRPRSAMRNSSAIAPCATARIWKAAPDPPSKVRTGQTRRPTILWARCSPWCRSRCPRPAPGSLEHADYEQIMAFLLQQNGYPAGGSALVFDSAAASKVPLLYHGG